MALQAPFHVQSIFFPHQRHLVNLPVAGLATDAFVNVYAMIEVDKIWKVVNASPFDGYIVAKTCANRFENGCFGPDLGVATHAGLGRRNTGKCSFFNRGVAVAAIDPHAGYMVLVAEGDGLIARYINLADVVDAVDVEDKAKQGTDDDETYDNAGS